MKHQDVLVIVPANGAGDRLKIVVKVSDGMARLALAMPNCHRDQTSVHTDDERIGDPTMPMVDSASHCS